METEIKLRVDNPQHTTEKLFQHGFEVLHPRVFERNLVFDTPDLSLRNSRRLLRLREAGGLVTLTFKGPAESGKHKSREEREVHPDNFDEMQTILERLGYQVTYTYDKYRTEFHRPEAHGIATIDETQAGTFVELEGTPEWIDRTAEELGFQESDYILASYAALYNAAAKNAASGDQTNAKSELAATAPASQPEP